MKIIAATAILAAVVGLSATSGAAADDRRCGNVPVENWMSEAQLRERVSALNLQIEEIDIDDGCYEVEARNSDGRELEITFHPATGEQISIDD